MAPDHSELSALRHDIDRLGRELDQAHTILSAVGARQRELDERLASLFQTEATAPPPVEIAVVEEPSVEDLRFDAEPTGGVHQPGLPTAEPHRPLAHAGLPDLDRLEATLGRLWLTWLGGLILVLAAGFTVHWVWITFDVPPGVKVAGLHGLGASLLGAAWVIGRRGQRLIGEALAGVGLFTLYATALAADRLYGVFTPSLALAECTALSYLAIAMAVAARSRVVILLGALGGFLAPHLAGPPGGDHVTLFLYYAVLNATLATTGIVRGWRFLTPLAYFATVAMFFLWLTNGYTPADRFSTFWLANLHMVIFLVATTLPAWLRRGDPLPSDGITAASNAVLHMLFTYALFFRQEGLRVDLLCGGLAALYAGLFWIGDRLAARDERMPRVHLAVACILATWTIPLALHDASYLGVCWCLEGLLISAVAVRFADLQLRTTAVLIFVLGILRLLSFDLAWDQPPLWTAGGIQQNVLTIAVGGLLAMLAGMVEWLIPRRTPFAPAHARLSAELAGTLLAAGNVLLLVSLRCQWDNRVVLALWTLDAALAWALGFYLRNAAVRIYAAVIGICLAGGYAVVLGERCDGSFLPLINARFVSLALLSALFAGAGWAYRRLATSAATPPRQESLESIADPLLAVLASGVLGVALVLETHCWFGDQVAVGQTWFTNVRMAEQAAYSIVGACYAVVLVAVGFATGHGTYRRLGMLGLLLVVAKVLTIDLAELRWLPRILALAVLGSLLLATSAIYQRLSRRPQAAPSEASTPRARS